MLFLLAALPAQANEEAVCNRFVIANSPGLGLTSSELALMCSNPGVEAWSNVTSTQALFYLRTFLELRGYHEMKSERVGDKIRITLGPLSRVKYFSLEGAPPHFGERKLRKIKGEVLSPNLLNQIEERLFQRLQSQGYACPEQKIQADPKSGEVRVRMTTGKRGQVAAVTSEKVDHFDAQALRRYDAFVIGAPFHGDWLRVTENRIVSDGVVQNSHFSIVCKDDAVLLHQKTVTGPPRSFAFGVGVNTERGPSIRGSWKHVRLGEMGSSIEFAAAASFRLQEITAKPKWYFLPYPSRLYFYPQLVMKREDEKFFERYSGILQLTPGTSWDSQNLGITLIAGPALNFMRAARGPGPKETEFMSLNGAIKIENHIHEFYQASPRSGFKLDLMAAVTAQGLASNVSAQMVRMNFESLYNLFDYDPAVVVLGVRGSLATTFVDPAASPRLPQSYRHFLGGSADLRGFPRNQLPGEEGGLTSAFVSAEIRLPDLLPWGLQPLALADFGAMGAKSATLDAALYYSPGLGVRWESPIGVIRSTLARGWITGAPADARAGIQLYVSYGEEF